VVVLTNALRLRNFRAPIGIEAPQTASSEPRLVAGVRIAPVVVVAGNAFHGTFENQRDTLATALEAAGLMKEKREA
jgi:hypothetical protein